VVEVEEVALSMRVRQRKDRCDISTLKSLDKINESEKSKYKVATDQKE
jgi:hypothetical protein